MICRGILTFKLNAQWENVTLPLVPSLTHLEQFAQGLQAYSDAQIVKATFMQVVYYDDALAASEANSSDVFAVALLENRDITEHRLHTLAIPAPKDLLWEPKAEGPRIAEEHGNALAVLYTALTEMNHRFRKGWKVASRP